MTRSPKSKPPADLRSLNFPAGVDVEGDFRIKPTETTAERQHRHRMEVRAYWIERAPVNLLAIFVIAGSTILSFFWAFRPNSEPEDKKWAVSVLSYLLVATAGFAFGKAATWRDA